MKNDTFATGGADMTISSSQPVAPQETLKAPAAKATAQSRKALRVIVIVLVASASAIPFYLILASLVKTWQVYALGGLTAAQCIICLVGIGLTRRGHFVWGIQLLIGGMAAIGLLAMLLISGLGLMVGLGFALIISQTAIQTLPDNQIKWGSSPALRRARQ